MILVYQTKLIWKVIVFYKSLTVSNDEAFVRVMSQYVQPDNVQD